MRFGDAMPAWGGGLWWLMSVALIVLFWGLVIAAIVLGIRWLIRADRRGRSDEGPPTAWHAGPGGAPGQGGPGAGPDALEILRQRYARGEIDDAEYERRRAVLQAPPWQAPPPGGPPLQGPPAAR